MEVSVELHYRPGRGTEVQPGLVVLDRPLGHDVRGRSGASATARRGACSTGITSGSGMQRGWEAAVAMQHGCAAWPW